jgi:dolichol-phosphate mannosyltransferase
MTSDARRDTVALVVPLYNEEDVLPALVREVEAFRAGHPEIDQVVLVDDGSTDRTAKLAKTLTEGRSGYVLLRFSRNFGHQLAVTAGLHFVRSDAAVVLDGDLQHPLATVGRMIERWRDGYDVVYGIRRTHRADSWPERLAARVYYRLFRKMTGVDAPVDAADFRLMSRAVLDAYRKFEEQQPYVRGLVAWLGFNQVGVEYEAPARAAGRSKYAWRDRFRLGIDGLASFSARPLRYAVRLGLAVSGLAFLGLVWVLISKLVLGNTVPGWASVTFVGFFFGGAQLFFLGVLGSYVARVYDEVKGRPRYVVREHWTSPGPRGEA